MNSLAFSSWCDCDERLINLRFALECCRYVLKRKPNCTRTFQLQQQIETELASRMNELHRLYYGPVMKLAI